MRFKVIHATKPFKSINEQADISSMLLSEDALAKDWLTPEEDKAWEHL